METTEPIAALETAALEQLKRHGLVQPGDRVIAAVSGGADSMALLLFFLRCGPALGLTVEVAHVDHGLRGEASARDAAFVAAFCRARGVPLHRFSAPEEGVVPPEGAGEAWARQLRYGFFERLCREHGAKLATAHTKNDQAETLLLHLARGCGPAGAAGIPAVRGAVIRPFLTVSRRQTEAYCRALGQPWVMDETNAADNYARNRVRRYALPALETVNPQAVEALARFCDRMALVDGYLAAQADTLLETAKQGSGWRLSTLNEAHPAVRDEAFARILGPNAREDAVARLAALARAGQGAQPLPGGLLARAQEGLLRLESLAPRHLRRRSGNATDGGPCPMPERPLTAGTIDWPGGWRITAQVMEYENFIKLQPVHKKDLNSCADYDKIQQYKPILRARMPGDRFQLPGRNCTKTLKKLLNEGHVPVAQRAALPLLAAPGGRVLWLCGQGFGAGLEPTIQTRQVLRLTVQRAETAEFEKSEEWNYEHE